MPAAALAATDATARRLIDQRAALARLTLPAAGKRADSRATWHAIATVMVRRMDWATGAITATHETLGVDAAALLGRAQPFSHDTVGRMVAAAIAAGVLHRPPGCEGKSRQALRSQHHQAPTYFVVEPAPTDAPASSPGGEVAYPSRSRSERRVQVEANHCLYERRDRKRPIRVNTGAVPATAPQRRLAAEWLRARLLVGVVPSWRLAAMLTTWFLAGLAVGEVHRRICHRPDASLHGPLPTAAQARAMARPGQGAADVLLGIIGYRLRLWRAVPAVARSAAVPLTAPPPAPLPAVRRRATPAAAALLAAIGLRAGEAR